MNYPETLVQSLSKIDKERVLWDLTVTEQITTLLPKYEESSIYFNH